MIPKLSTPRAIQLPLRANFQKRLLLLAVCLPGLLLAAEAVRIGIAATVGDSAQTADLQKALRIDPADPVLHERLGLLETYSFEGASGRAGLSELREAVRMSPYNARYWGNLASAYESFGEFASATQAVERTLELSPMTPRYRWLAGNFYLRRNQIDLAFAQFRCLLRFDSSYAEATFPMCLKATGNPEQVEEEVVPFGNVPVELAYVNFLNAKGQDDFAIQVWNKIADGKTKFPFALAEPYLDDLIAASQEQQAMTVWQDLERLGVIVRPASQVADNLVFNGSFEQPPLNAGFDWRSQQQPYLMVTFDDPGAYQGARCLRVDFTVSQNREYEPVYQLVAVKPNQAYQLTAYVRSLDITSDSGPCLRVSDPACRECLNVQSETTIGTTPWHKIALQFSTGAHTRLIRLSVWRARSYGFPPQIGGSFRLDDVQLKALQPLAPQASVKP